MNEIQSTRTYLLFPILFLTKTNSTEKSLHLNSIFLLNPLNLRFKILGL